VVQAETFNLSVRGVGFFPGLEDVIEYNNLARPSINDGQISINSREILNIECIDLDTVTVQFREQFDALKGKTVDSQDESYELRFKSNSSLIIDYTARLPPVLIEAYAAEVYDARHICDAATMICVGDLFPYESLDECYRIMTSLPVDCEPRCYDCYEKNAPFQGDTRLCRSLHLLSAQLRPTFHCAHMADISAKCYAEQCPSAKRKTAEEVDELLKFFDAGLAPSVESFELFMACLLFLAPFATYSCFFCKRRSFVVNNLDVENESLTKHSESAIHEEQKKSPRKRASLGPWMRCALEMSRTKKNETKFNNTVFATKSVDFGGCKLTSLEGPSGCGKSSMMRLICGFVQPHMELKIGFQSPPCKLAYTAQSADLWPKYMTVRDIFLFSSTLQNTQIKDYEECISILKIGHLIDRVFGGLSGGEQQRVHCLASMMRPDPTLLFMDEPLSGLDEESAVAFIMLLKELPVEHTFCLSIHQMSPRIEQYMDRKIFLDEKSVLVTHCSQTSIQIARSSPEYDKSLEVQPGQLPSFVASLKAMIILWHSEYFALPTIEIGIIFLCGFTSLLVSLMSAQSLYGSDEGHVPASQAVRIPVMLLQMLSNLLVISCFGVSMIYAMTEKDLISQVVGQKDMRLSALVVVNLFRLSYHGLIAATVEVGVFMVWTNLGKEEWDLIIINCGLLLAGCLALTYSVGIVLPPSLSSQVAFLVILPMMFFSGVFFLWNGISPFFKAIHYISPLFYCLHACANLILDGFSGKCDAKASPYLECANKESIVEAAQIREIPSSWSQLSSLVLIFIGLSILAWHFRERKSYKPLSSVEELEALTSSESNAFGSLNATSSACAGADPVRSKMAGEREFNEEELV